MLQFYNGRDQMNRLPDDCTSSPGTLFCILGILEAHDRDLVRIPVFGNTPAPSAGQYRKLCARP